MVKINKKVWLLIFNSFIYNMSQLPCPIPICIPYRDLNRNRFCFIVCAGCKRSCACVDYHKRGSELTHKCTSCCFAPLCEECENLHSITCLFCPGQASHVRHVDKNRLGGSNGWGWICLFKDIVETSEALDLMPHFLSFLSACPVKIGFKDVNTPETYDMYVEFMQGMRTKMGLHLLHGFCFSFRSIRVIERNGGAFDAMTKQFFLSNQAPLSPWKPKRRELCRFRFGLISIIASKMATGPFQARLTDRSTCECIIRMHLMRMFSFSK
jgi:hypothetical protein